MKNPIYYETVSQALSELRKRGYNVDFSINDDKGAYFTCSNITSPLSPDEFEIDETYRFEGNTDPSDAMIVYAISSKKHAVKGVIANAYGTYADACTSLLVDKLVTHDRKNDKKKVIVIGGGFAGVQFVQKIDETVFDILLIDRINHHQFQPLFYQVATSQLEPASISFPLRNIFKKKKNLQIRLTEVLHIKPDLNLIQTTIGDFDYDILVIAIGCQTNFFGNEEISKNAFTLKTTYDAINIRNHILQLFESLISSNEEEKEYLQNLIIVGAGPTGVELAGAFSEIKNDILPKDYPGIDFSKFNITLIEGSPHTLNSMSIQAKETSRKYLEEMGVKLRMETFVKNYDGKILTLSNGEIIKSKTVIWAAGVIGNRIEGFADTHITSSNRIKVNRMNLINDTKNIYAIGDIAYMETPLYPKGHPQLANVAINQAKNLAKNLNRLIQKEPMQEFEYKDLGSMATVGRNKAVVDLPNFKLKGYFAWFIWMFLHLMLILSIRNKLIIFINWAWAYLMKDTSLRLILRKTS